MLEEGRKTTRRELAIQGRRVPGKVHEFHEGGEIDYIFERSDQVPFSFISMNLKYGQVHLFATLDSSLAVAPQNRVSSEKTEWQERAEATTTRISEWQKANPNYRFWTVTTRQPNGTSTEERLLAEWAGENKPRLEPSEGGRFFSNRITAIRNAFRQTPRCPTTTKPRLPHVDPGR